MRVNSGDELDRKQRRGRLYNDDVISDNTFGGLDNNNGNDDFKKQVFDEIFLSGSMPNVTRVLSEQFIDYIEGNCKDYKLLPYVLLFFIDIILRGIAQVPYLLLFFIDTIHLIPNTGVLM